MILRFLASLIFLASTSAVWAESLSDEELLESIYGDAEFISIATGNRQHISQAPATATVITAEDIQAMGATDLDQALEAVPGLHVSVSSNRYSPIYTMRGIFSGFNPQVLVLINGIPITNIFQGNRSQVWGGMPVADIARIEVVRGPGSALFGADAFAGTINIITKTAQDIPGTQAGVRAGSFNTKDAWLLHGGKWGGVDVAFSLELHGTDGQRETVAADAQTGLDALFGTHVSLAPGPVNTQRDTLDTRLDLAQGDWRLRLGYQGRRDIGSGGGISQALDPSGLGDSDRYNADLTYHNPVFAKDWDVTMQLSYFNVTQLTDLVIFPPGAFKGAFPDGVIGNPDVYERHWRLGVSSLYTGFAGHQIRLGTGFNRANLYKVREVKNFSQASGPLPISLGDLVDVTDSAPFIRPHSRDVLYALLQDEWSFIRDWSLTAGVRWDHYSDFGDTVNPRLALIWLTRHDLTTKFLYGRAFRAPSFAELYNINNPVVLGNPDLKPETINTLELLFDYRPTNELRTNLSFFRYKTADNIRFVPDPAPATTSTAQNTGSQTGYGFEWEWNWRLNRELKLRGNYAFQRSTDDATNHDAGNAPHHHIYARAEWKFTPEWNLMPQINWVAGRERVAGDARPQIDNYTTLDLTLRRKQKGEPWGVAGSVRNLFDADVREPSLAPGGIPNDLPLPGRNFYLELSYNLQ
ncbi:MAG: TonB-dependent receptor [Gammaproteobacteria bacterium]|nr:TonB-dependent receptor [Gammaproteobacteria bacterium]